MAKFRFMQDKEIKTWVRDWYEIEAETYEDAVRLIDDECATLDYLESKHPDVVQFVERDDAFVGNVDEEEVRAEITNDEGIDVLVLELLK